MSSTSPKSPPVEEEKVLPDMPTYPPYPPYEPEPTPPTVADVILLGQDIRYAQKSAPPLKVKPTPRPARPKVIKATTEVKMTNRERIAHARCLRRYTTVLTDRLERMSKPDRRRIIYMWRDRQETLPVDTIARLRAMLDADEPFKPEQAYDYFLTLRKSKKKSGPGRRKEMKKDVMALCEDRRYEWARNAAVAFARGIQQRLARPGLYSLQDEMLRLSNMILKDICSFLKTKTPSRHCSHPKAQLMVEIADKVAVWINEVLQESEDRMLMMDFDENDEVTEYLHGEAAFADDFLNMMGGSPILKGSSAAALNFNGVMTDAFDILTNAMYEKGNKPFITNGKFSQTYEEAANELKQTPDFRAKDFNTTLAEKITNDLTAIVKPTTPQELAPSMQRMIRLCSNYLAQNAEYSKEKGKAFHHLVESMKNNSKDKLYEHGKEKKSMRQGANDLTNAKGFETTHDDPNLSQAIHSNLKKSAPPVLKKDMKEALDYASKYLSEKAVDQKERGPAFDTLMKQLIITGSDDFAPQFKDLKNNNAAVFVLCNAPGLEVTDANPEQLEIFKKIFHSKIDIHTPPTMQKEMKEVINRCSKYLSSYVQNRDEALNVLLKEMQAKPNEVLIKRKDYTMKYSEAVDEIKQAPNLVSHLPIKDIADEIKGKLNDLVKGKTSPLLEKSMTRATDDAGKYLSQMVAIRSGAAGESYAIDYLSAVKESLGQKPLTDQKGYPLNYKDAADVLKYAGELLHDPQHDDLRHTIHSEMKSGVGSQVSPTMRQDIQGVMGDAAKHLAKEAGEKGDALRHLISMMKEKGDEPLGVLQGYAQTYQDGARRLDNASSLANDNVDKAAYENVRAKLTQLAEKSPSSEKHAQLPGVIKESAKFLAAPVPKSEAEKRAVLADMMARKGDETLAESTDYKMNYTEAGKEIMNSQKGKTRSRDPSMQEKIQEGVKSMVPEKRNQEVLQGTIEEGAAHLTDVVKGRGEALDVIQNEMMKEKNASLVSAGKFGATYEQGAQMIKDAPNLTAQSTPAPALQKEVHAKLNNLDKTEASPEAQKHMQSATKLASQYIAGEATAKSGLNAEQLAALEGDYGFGPGIGPDGKPLKDGGARSSKTAAGTIGEAGAGSISKSGSGTKGKAGGGRSGEAGSGSDDETGPGGTGKARSGKGKAGGGRSGEAGSGSMDESGAGGIDKAGSGRNSKAGGGISGAAGSGSYDEAGAGGIDKAGSGRNGKAGGGRSGEAGSGSYDEAGAGGIGKAGSGKNGKAGGGISGETGSGSYNEVGAGGIGKTGSGRIGKAGGGRSGEAGSGSYDEAGAGGIGKAALGKNGKAGGVISGEAGSGSYDEAGAGGIGKAGSGRNGKAGGGSSGEAGSGSYNEAGAGGIGKTGSGRIGKAGGGRSGEAGSGSYDEAGVGGIGKTGSGRIAKAGGGKSGEAGSGSYDEAGAGVIGKAGSDRNGKAGGVRSGEAGSGSYDEAGAGGIGKARSGRNGKAGGVKSGEAGTGSYDEARAGGIGKAESGRSGKAGGGRSGEAGSGSYDDDKAGGGSDVQGGRAGSLKLKSPTGSPTKAAGSNDPLREDALVVLHKQLQSKGDEVLYKQPLTTLTNRGASEWIKEKPLPETDSSIKDSPDTNRLANKLEKKLNTLVDPRTPPHLKDTMQDVVIEKSRQLSERFVDKNYKALVKERLVSEMQKKGNEILVDVDGNTETYFYTAQRLKHATTLDTPDPWPEVAQFLHKKLDDVMKVRPIPRKLVNTTKEHTKVAANFLSKQVTLPNEVIAAYVALLEEMEARGNQLLVEDPTYKTYKEAATYLESLTSFEDTINRPNNNLKGLIVSKLKKVMPENPTGYTKSALDTVIQDSSKLLTSYIMLQGEKTEALKVLIEEMDENGHNVLLRHGDICKTYRDGSDRLRGKNADQIGLVSNVDPVVARKISIKLNNLMKECTPNEYVRSMDDVIEDATLYLAANFLHPHIIKVCKCMKNVFVQCELWCDEILRHVSRPCCTCSRHAVSGLCSSHRMVSSNFNTPNMEVALIPCPDRQKCLGQSSQQTSSSKPPSNQNPTTSYALHSIVYDNLPFHYTKSKTQLEPTREISTEESTVSVIDSGKETITTPRDSETKTTDEPRQLMNESENDESEVMDFRMEPYYGATPSSSIESSKWQTLWQTANSMFGHMHLHQDLESVTKSNAVDSRAPIVTTDEMSDWHAMVVSLLWNMQAWRRWIQENIDIALRLERPVNNWVAYEKRVTSEALQWRHYNVFSRQLTLRLNSRYKNKRVVSPTRATDRTDEHVKRQTEMLAVTDMFRVWTQWLHSVIQETNSLKCPEGSTSATLNQIRWNHYKEKIEEYADHWQTFNLYLKSCWESDNMKLMSGLMSHWEPSGAVWVVSACGAVPSGAVSCGVVRGENTWLARTTHKRRVLPGTLHPSKHCCIVYAEGGVHHYTKYQVLCNANVCWLSWRSGSVSARAVCIADGVYAGRVLYRGSHLLGPVLAPSYRCHVVLFGRPFAFNCFQLLVQAEDV